MKKQDPKLSIGLPVYNGENFIREAIDSILTQTFHDFELIIADNASSDGTEEICRHYADIDWRVRYYRNEENIGSSGNYTRVFQLAKGKYFKWAAHDDVCKPDFIEKCIEVLDKDESVVLCYTRTITIDSEGRPGKKWIARPEFAATMPHRRFREVFARRETFPIWGVMRTDILKKTPLLGNYPAHDRPLLTELSLYGRFYEIPEFLFLEREHAQRSVRLYNWRKPHEAVVWYDPKLAGKIIFPSWRLLKEHIAGIHRAPINMLERVRCYIEMIKWEKQNKKDMLRDLIFGGSQIRFIGPIIKTINKKKQESRWMKQTVMAAKDIESLIPANDVFILVDEASFDADVFTRWKTLPFTERNGQYWGPPQNDVTAINELERLRKEGAGFIVFGWPTFWWFDHYSRFSNYLNLNFQCKLRNDRLIAFDIRS